MNTDFLLGLTLEEAQKVLKNAGLKHTVVIPGTPGLLNADFQRDRVNLEIEDGKVVFAKIG